MNGLPDLSVVIVNWNSGSMLRDCILSMKQCSTRGFRIDSIIVIDNGSTDGSLESADLTDPRITHVRNRENLGFAKACNQGASKSRSKYLLLLNPDTRLFEDSLVVPLQFMEAQEARKVGVTGIQNVNDDGVVQRTCARFPTPALMVGRSLGLSRMFPKWVKDHFLREWPHDSDRCVDQIMGSFFLVRRALWDRLGGFDERFFVYYEELDFSLRASHSGWQSWYLAGAQFYHKGGGTSEKVKAKRLFYSLRSRLLYARKHFSWSGFAMVCTATALAEPVVRITWCIARRDLAGAEQTVKGYGMLYRELPSLLSLARRTL